MTVLILAPSVQNLTQAKFLFGFPWKGGAIILSSLTRPTTVEFHRCSVGDNVAGAAVEDDPQGEGGAIVVGGGSTLILEDCLLLNNTCGKKVCEMSLCAG